MTKKSLKIDPEYKEGYRNLFVYYYDEIKNYDSAAFYAFEYTKRGGNLDAEVLKYLEQYRK